MADDAIEQAFIASWDRMEQFYSYRMFTHQVIGSSWKHVMQMLDVIAGLRKQGYDRRLRAGQQLDALVLSRSRAHGLRFDQASFGIETHQDGKAFTWYFEPPDMHIEFDLERVEITPEVEDLLNRLLAHPID